MKNSLYDLHVATDTPEGDEARTRRDKLHATFLAMGITDDDLITHGITVNEETGRYYESCPLIDIHASIKANSRRELGVIEASVRRQLEAAGLPGYWHSELVAADVSHDGKGQAWNGAPFFTKPIATRPRMDILKEWDVHLAMPQEDVDPALDRALIGGGLYRISRWKTREDTRKPWAIYNLQGVSDVHDGQLFHRELVRWLLLNGAPRFDAKMEVTTDMQLYNNPRAIPPVTDNIVYTVA